jgi:hypothetical protein
MVEVTTDDKNFTISEIKKVMRKIFYLPRFWLDNYKRQQQHLLPAHNTFHNSNSINFTKDSVKKHQRVATEFHSDTWGDIFFQLHSTIQDVEYNLDSFHARPGDSAAHRQPDGIMINSKTWSKIIEKILKNGIKSI